MFSIVFIYICYFINLPSWNLDPTNVTPIGSPVLLYLAGTVSAGYPACAYTWDVWLLKDTTIPAVSCASTIGIILFLLTTPMEGLIPTTEFSLDGYTRDPAVFVPIEATENPAATEDADPELDPPTSYLP